MICPSCGNDTQGTETSPGTVSSTCPPCNLKLTGRSHHPDAYDVDAKGNRIAVEAPMVDPSNPIVLDRVKLRKLKARQPS